MPTASQGEATVAAAEGRDEATVAAAEGRDEATVAAAEGATVAAAERGDEFVEVTHADAQAAAPDAPRAADEEDHKSVLLSDLAAACEPFTGDDVVVTFEGDDGVSDRVRYWVAVLLAHVLCAEDAQVLQAVIAAIGLAEPVAEGILYLAESVAPAGLPPDQLHDACAGIPPNTRFGVVVALVTCVLKSGCYDARARWALRRMAVLLGVPWQKVAVAESALAGALLDAVAKQQQEQQIRKKGVKRWLKVGAGVVIGGGLLVVTGGLAAPVIAAAAAGVATATAGVASAAGLGAIAAAVTAGAAALLGVLSVAVITTLFGVAGAGLTGYRVYRRTGELRTFRCRSARVGGEAWDELPDGVMSQPCVALAAGSGTAAVVAVGTRGTAAANCVKKLGSRATAVSIEHLVETLGPLRLAAQHAAGGKWRFEWPAVIPPGRAAVAVLQRGRFSTSTTACAVYKAQVSGRECEVCVATERGVLTGRRAAVCVAAPGELSADAAAAAVHTLVGCRQWAALPDEASIAAVEVTDSDEVVLTFSHPSESCVGAGTELQGRVRKLLQIAAPRTQKAVVAVQNGLEHGVVLRELRVLHGEVVAEHPFAKRIPPGLCTAAAAQNKKLRPVGAAVAVVYTHPADGDIPAVHFCFAVHGSSSDARASAVVTEELDAAAFDQVGQQAAAEDGVAMHLVRDRLFCVSWSVKGAEASFRLREVRGANAAAAGSETSGLHVTIGVGGMTVGDDPRVTPEVRDSALWVPLFTRHAGALDGEGADPYFITWDPELQRELGDSLTASSGYGDMVASTADFGARTAMKNPAVAASAGLAGASYAALSTFAAAFAFPYYAVQAGSVIDSTYAMLKTRAKDAGAALADMLLSGAQGKRPVTLIGLCLGGNAVFHCLTRLAAEPDGAGLGLVECAYVLGSTISNDAAQWEGAKRAVAGRLVNGYSSHDWWLAFLHRSTGQLGGISGMGRVEGRGVENVNLAHLITQSADYIRKAGDILDFIPPWPTAQTLSQGEAVPGTAELLEVADEAMGAVAGSVSAATKAAVAVRNKLDAEVIVMEAEVATGRWVISPTSEIPPQHAALMAARGGVAGRGSLECSLKLAVGDALIALCVRRAANGGQLTACVSDDPEPACTVEGTCQPVVQGQPIRVRWACIGDCVEFTLKPQAKEDEVEEAPVAVADDAAQDGLSRQDTQPALVVSVPQSKESVVGTAAALRGGVGTSCAALGIRNKTPFVLVFEYDDVVRGEWARIPPDEIAARSTAVLAMRGSLRTGGAAAIACFTIEDKGAVVVAAGAPVHGSAVVAATVTQSAEQAETIDRRALLASAKAAKTCSYATLAGRRLKLTAKPVPPHSALLVSVKLLEQE